MKIARVILELSIPDEWSELDKHNQRAKLRRHLLTKEVGPDGGAYQERIRRVISKAKDESAEIVVLPAYSIVLEYAELSQIKWRNLVLRDGPAAVVAGAIRPRTPAPKWLHEEESLFAVESGETVFYDEAFGPLPVMMNGRTTIAAISSSVGHLRDYPRVFGASAALATKKSPLFVFDMGHDQYTGQYIKTLTTVVGAMLDAGAARVVLALAFWRWRGGNSLGSWAFDDRSSIKYVRRTVDLDDDSGRQDYVDIFEI